MSNLPMVKCMPDAVNFRVLRSLVCVLQRLSETIIDFPKLLELHRTIDINLFLCVLEIFYGIYGKLCLRLFTMVIYSQNSLLMSGRIKNSFCNRTGWVQSFAY